jgi:hypothetical protein
MKEFKSKPIKGIDSLDEYSLYNISQSENGKRGAKVLHENHKDKWKEGTKRGGSVQGKINAENGHLDRIRKISNEKRFLPILQYDKDGNFIKEWKSTVDAANFYKKTPSCINLALKGTNKTAAGFIWKYKENNLDN